jgi:hypothetical protein
LDTPGTPQSVADDEVLYRAIRSDANLLKYDDVNPRISSNAFNDALRRPSVDRACLCTDGPTDCQMRFAPGSGVLSLLTSDVREISATHGVTGIVYCADVEAVPLSYNATHAEIYGKPQFDTDKVFVRIKHALARIAQLELAPTPKT